MNALAAGTHRVALTERERVRWEYAPAPESPDSAQLKERYELFVAGAWKPPIDGARHVTINPATGAPLAEVSWAGPQDVANAVAAAHKAAPKWATVAPLERGKVLFRVARLIQERARELAVVETLDGGKPIRESRDVDIPLAAAHFFYYAGWADKLVHAVAGRGFAPRGVVAQSCRGTSRS